MAERSFEECVPAVFRLAMMRKRCPDLGRAETDARNLLALSLIEYQESDPANGLLAHEVKATAVNSALLSYGVAMANLLRGARP